MTRGEIILLMLLLLNVWIAAGYLIWHWIVRREKEKRYVIHTAVMLLCPLVGCLYFSMAFVKQLFWKVGDRDLADVEFSKKRHVPRVKADRERERNIVAVKDAILVSDREKKRTNMLNILLGETDESLSAIALALGSDDSEVSHYAASFLQSKMDVFRENVRNMQREINAGDVGEEACQQRMLELIEYMNQILKQRVLMQVEQLDYVEQMEQLCENLFQNAKSKLTPACYEYILARTMELGEYERAERWGERLCEQYPDHLASYTLRLKLYFETNRKDKFFEVMDQLRASSVIIDNQTLEMIRMIQR